MFRRKKSDKLFLVNQHIAVGDREIHDGTEPGYRKANADISLYRYIAVASHFSARASLACGKMTMHRWPRARYVLRMVTLSSGNSRCTLPIVPPSARATSDRVTILIDIPRLSVVHDQLPFLFLLIYLFSIKENGREKGRTFYCIVDTYLFSQTRRIHREKCCFIISRCVKWHH